MTIDTTDTTTTAAGLAGLAELQRVTAQIVADIAAAREAGKQAIIDHQAAVEAVETYHRDVAAGRREDDPEALSGLVAARDRLSDEMRRDPRNGKILGHMPAEGRVEALTADREAARRAEAAYVREHEDEITAELLDQAREARAKMHRAQQAIEQAHRAWQNARLAWQPFMEAYGIDARHFPPHPLDQARDAVRRAGVPRGERTAGMQWLTPAPWPLIADEIAVPDNPRANVHVPGITLDPASFRRKVEAADEGRAARRAQQR